MEILTKIYLNTVQEYSLIFHLTYLTLLTKLSLIMGAYLALQKTTKKTAIFFNCF